MKLVIVGGGAAGLFAASHAAEAGVSVTVLERNRQTCRKVCITGKGRCNVTNACEPDVFLKNVATNPRFLNGAVRRFTPADTVAWFEGHGVPLKTERGNRVFPVSDSAYDIADALLAAARHAGARIVTGRACEVLTQAGHVSGVRYETDGTSRVTSCDAVLIATGGCSYPGTGSDGDGYRMARDLGHRIVEPQGSLVPLEADAGICAAMQGLSLRNTGLTLTHNGKKVYQDFGELLFTHFGLSGPVILSASAHMDLSDGWQAVLDLKPALDEGALDARVLRDFGEETNRDFGNSLNALLPRKMVPVVVGMSGIAPETKVHSVTKEQRRALVRLLKAFPVDIRGKRPISEAIITSGGVDVRETDPRTMQSRIVPGLYFAGEVLDTDAYTGGFNLQIAWSTAYAAAQAIASLL